jgi:hypothetical protein
MTQSILAQKVRYSTRNTRGRYLQRLLLDTARCLAPTLAGSWREFERATLHVAGDAARLELEDKQALQADPSLTATQIDILNVMGAALARQITRLTGVTAFELATWHNTLLTQPVEICFITAAGRRLRLFNPSFSANRYFHAIVALSEALEAHYGLQARQPQDLDALIDAGHLEGWIVDPVADAEIATEALVLDWSPTSLARARAEFGASDLPEKPGPDRGIRGSPCDRHGAPHLPMGPGGGGSGHAAHEEASRAAEPPANRGPRATVALTQGDLDRRAQVSG